MVHRPAPVLEAARRLLRLADLRCARGAHGAVSQGHRPHGESIRAIYDGLATRRFFLEKTAFGCCGDAGFETLLQQAQPMLRAPQRQIVIAGIEAHVCVMQTVLELLAQARKCTSAGTPPAGEARNTGTAPWTAWPPPAPPSPTTSPWPSSGPGTRTTPSSRPSRPS
ncbi:MAG: isochorismatase family protein [Holophagaceae bacterium]|nr:isochorismatase family protein [Holophagaceae bacterium]